MLSAGLLAAAPSAGAAASTVPVAVTLHDTAGAPVVGETIFGDYGPDSENDYSGAETDSSGLAVLHVPPESTVRLSFSVVRETGGTPDRSPITVDAGPAGTATTVVVPTRWGRTYTVVDPQGRAVAKAHVRMDVLVSTVVTDAVRGNYRMVDAEPWGYQPPGDVGEINSGATGTNGRTSPMRWYEPEPDPAIACALTFDAELCDQDDDGTPDGMFVELDGPQGYPYATGVAVPYTQWTAPSSATMTLHVPAVPVVEVVSQRPGTRTGEALLTVRVTKPSGSGYVPAAHLILDAVRSPSAGTLAVTDGQGLAEILYTGLAGPATVSVARYAGASVAATVTLQPRLGVGFARARYNPPGKDTRSAKSLNREYVRLANTSASSVSLRHWTVRNTAGNRYTFGHLTLRPGATVTLHTGPGHDTRTDRYWGAGRPRWDNRDRATLRMPSGSVVATCDWGRGGGLTTCLAGAVTG